jgi:acetyl-CoA C-acetyltransferase
MGRIGSIKDRVAIVGMGCTKFGENWQWAGEDMIVDAAHEAYEDAGITQKDIGMAWYGCTQSARGGPKLAHALKLDYIPVTRIENHCTTGTDALRAASYAVAAGMIDFGLIVGFEKLKDLGLSGLPIWPEISDSQVRPFLPPPFQFALSATRYFHHYKMSYEEGRRMLAKVAVKNHKHGVNSPKAHLRREITEEQVLKAPMIAYPFGLFDCCGVSDGAAAAIVTTPEIAKTLKDDYVTVKGIGIACGAFQGQLHDKYDFIHFEENVRARMLAYEEAGVTDPRKQLDLAEMHDCFTITELISAEDLLFSERGGAGKDYTDGVFTAPDGELPLNTDGGLKSFGHPIGASGLRMIYEVYKQIQGKAQTPERQLKKADMGLTHNLGGFPGRFTSAVSIIGRHD